MPLVSVILTSYNRPHLVVQAIDSVLSSTLKDLELVVVDDSSNDETINALIDATIDDERACVVFMQVNDQDRETQCRYSVCINEGLEYAQGKYISYLTDDDFLYPDALLELSRFLDNTPHANTVYGDQHVATMDASGITVINYRRGTMGVTTEPQCRVDHCSVMHRRELLDKISIPWWPEGPEHWGAADAAFWGKLVDAGGPFYDIPVITGVHHWHGNNIQTRMIGGKSPIYTEEI